MITLQEALASGRGLWRSFTCPNPDHHDRSPSARVNSVSGKWVCMSCGAKGHAEGYQPDPVLMIEDTLRALDHIDGPRVYPESWLDQYDAQGPGDYWLSRFSPQACREHRLGWDAMEMQAVYPFRDEDGTVLGVVRRGRPGEKPKYRYPFGVDASKHLFGYHRAVGADVVVVCEGAPDAVAATEIETALRIHTGLVWRAVGTYGKVLHPAQVTLLHRLAPRVVVMAYNGDEAGVRGQQRAWYDLGKAGLMPADAVLPPGKDLGELSQEQRFDTLLLSLEVWPRVS
jgi:hypothetical protein